MQQNAEEPPIHWTILMHFPLPNDEWALLYMQCCCYLLTRFANLPNDRLILDYVHHRNVCSSTWCFTVSDNFERPSDLG